MYILEGNIGVGKTTFLKLLPRYYSGLELIPEPRETWSRLVYGQSLLSNFYHNPRRWAYTIETVTMICRFQDHLREQKKDGINRLLERSIYSGYYCFAKNGYDNGFLSELEWKLYTQWADFLLHKNCTPPLGFIYLKARPEICFERVQKRGLATERELSLEYLKQLDRLHDNFLQHKKEINDTLKKIPVLTIDCDQDFLENEELMAEHARKLQLFLQDTQNRNSERSLNL